MNLAQTAKEILDTRGFEAVQDSDFPEPHPLVPDYIDDTEALLFTDGSFLVSDCDGNWIEKEFDINDFVEIDEDYADEEEIKEARSIRETYYKHLKINHV